jgi:hypothetical protein
MIELCLCGHSQSDHKPKCTGNVWQGKKLIPCGCEYYRPLQNQRQQGIVLLEVISWPVPNQPAAARH